VRTTHFLTILLLIFLATSCGEEISFSLGKQTTQTNKLIEGQVSPMIGLVSGRTDRWYSSLNAYAGVCDAEVSLYKLSETGEKNLPAVATATVDAQAKFKFENLNLDLDPDYSNYLIEVMGIGGGPCDVVYQRPLMGQLTKQDVNYSSTLLSYTLIADLPKKIHQVNSTSAEELMNAITGGSLDSTFSQLLNDQNLRDQFFELFGGNPEKLLDIPPTITRETVPSILNEEVIHQFEFKAIHWSASYDIVVKWKLDGTTIQTSSIGADFFYTPGMNESGTHTLQAFIGKNDGTGQLDTNFSYQVKSYNLLVNNNSLPIVPSFSLASSITSASSVLATVQTGADLINCISFSSFAFTVDDANTPAASSVSSPCTDSLNQNATISLNGDGPHQVRLWVKDSSNLVIGSNPISITRDSTNPQTQLAADRLIYSSGEAIALTFSASDNLGLAFLELFKSEDGTTFSKVTDLNLSDTTYSLAAPTSNISNFKLKLKATDNAGLINETIITLLIDVDAPAAPIISLVSVTPTNSTSAQLIVATCSDVDKILIKESSASPSKTDQNWQSCTTSLSGILHTISLGDGVKTLYAFAKDAAGNISSVSNSVSATLDQTSPTVPNLANYPYDAFNSNSLQFTVANCTGISGLLLSESTSTPALSNSSWQACSTSNGGITHTLSSTVEGDYSLYAWAKDSAGNISAVKNITLSVDSSAPVLSSLKINDDDVYTGTSFVSLKVGVSDNYNSIKVHFVEANATTGDCASEYSVNNEWYSWTSATQEFSFALSNMDGVKKVCVWAKDAANNITATSISDDIQFFVANPPKLVALNVYNPADNSRTYTSGNNNLNIDWSISSTLDLAPNPLSFAYTTSGGTYKDIITNQDISDPTKMTWLGGIGPGLKSASGSYTSFPAPTSFFKLKVFVKDVSGNIGIPVISNIQNSGNWSVYAGTDDRGVGGAGKSAILKGGLSQTTLIAIHPTSNDIYAVDSGQGIKKLDARTGLVSVFIGQGTNNLLSNNGILPAKPLASISSPIMYFDKGGLLYLSLSGYENVNTASIYQINPTTREVKLYLPGGSEIGSGSTPPAVTQMNIARFLGVDDENSLYVAQNCAPGTLMDISLGHRKYKIVKVTQNSLTKTALEAINIAGNCNSPATPADGSIAIENPLPALMYPAYMNVIAWEGGKNLYFFDYYSATPYKIISGKFYSANTLTGIVSGVYQPSTGKIFAARNTIGLAEFIPNLVSANGDVVSTISGPSSNGCSEDDIFASSSCPQAWTPPVMNAQGKIFFADGNYTNTTSPYRVRYISSDQKIKTIFGTKALYGEGLSANLARGQFGGIYYKKSTELNQAKFSEGLYFVEASGPAFGYINPANKLTSIVWGDQSFRNVSASGSSVSNQTSMGQPYFNINGQALTFDSTGLPWLTQSRTLSMIDSNFNNIEKTIRPGISANRYETRPDDANISDTTLYVEGFHNNLQLSSTGLGFILGSYDYTTAPMKPVLKVLNFSNAQNGEIPPGKLRHLMGDSTKALTSADSAAPITSKSFSATCIRGLCSTYYDEVNNRLYFAEDTKIRYIDNANSPSIATLNTLNLNLTQNVLNFTFSPDMSTLYYIAINSKLYCQNITSSRAECSTSTPLGPTTGASGFYRVPNQFAWKNSSTLFISNYNGVIYEYTVP
jgi:hypothetical protein